MRRRRFRIRPRRIPPPKTLPPKTQRRMRRQRTAQNREPSSFARLAAGTAQRRSNVTHAGCARWRCFVESLDLMNPAQKALWFVESHLADELTLDDISDVAGVTRFHMVRAFAAATGFSVMRYVRARRLSEAARSLASGAPDILQVALDAEYGSHEAFTRAFRDHFGLTPETVRSLACIEDLKLQEPIQMNSSIIENL